MAASAVHKNIDQNVEFKLTLNSEGLRWRNGALFQYEKYDLKEKLKERK